MSGVKLQDRNALQELESHLQRVDETTFHGYVFSRRNPSARVVVEATVDGVPICLVRAEEHDPALSAAGVGDGCYGLTIVVNRQGLRGHRILAARIANTQIAVGQPIDLAPANFPPLLAQSIGTFNWLWRFCL